MLPDASNLLAKIPSRSIVRGEKVGERGWEARKEGYKGAKGRIKVKTRRRFNFLDELSFVRSFIVIEIRVLEQYAVHVFLRILCKTISPSPIPQKKFRETRRQ